MAAVERKMHASLLTALSPLDGRYAGRLDPLRPWLSEFGLLRCRVQVEVEWFIALTEAGLAELAPLEAGALAALRGVVRDFGPADAEAIKAIERRTNHDVKAVEYWLGERFAAVPALAGAVGFIHFACTSEDINNASHALMLEAARREVLLPSLVGLVGRLAALARVHAAQRMLARTHGQTATPTRSRRSSGAPTTTSRRSSTGSASASQPSPVSRARSAFSTSRAPARTSTTPATR
jgi:adenylosuccinate lyase